MAAVAGQGYPGGLTELEFVAAYRDGLRKSEIAADLALKALAFAERTERVLLTGSIAEQLVETCLRLVAVYEALSDRRQPVGRTLMEPLPGAGNWRGFVHIAATTSPEQMLREMGLGEEALASADQLRAQPDLAALSDLVEAATQWQSVVLPPPSNGVTREAVCWMAGIADDGTQLVASLDTGVGDGAALADLTADLCSIARGFLGAYVDARRSAGRRD
jgi:hypothetical protein